MNTACRPSAEEPSVITANATLFCRRTDFTQPLTWIGLALEVPDDNNCRMVGVRLEAKVARERRKIMATDQNPRSVNRRFKSLWNATVTDECAVHSSHGSLGSLTKGYTRLPFGAVDGREQSVSRVEPREPNSNLTKLKRDRAATLSTSIGSLDADSASAQE